MRNAWLGLASDLYDFYDKLQDKCFFYFGTKFYETMKLTTFKEHLEKQYGKVGTPKREEFDKNSKAFAIAELSLKKELDFNTLNKNQTNGI